MEKRPNLLTESERATLNVASNKVYDLMRNFGWHTATEIIKKSGQREGLRRLRELRKYYEVDKMKMGGFVNEWCYRLIKRDY